MSLNPDYESLTVSTTAVGLTASTYQKHSIATVTVEDGSIRVRVDGTNPTASEGHMARVGSVIYLLSANDIQNFRAIRAESTNATIRVSYGVGTDSFRIDDSAIIDATAAVGNVTVDNADGATSVPVQGSDPHDDPAANNPVQVAGYGSSTAPADTDNGDITRAWYNLNGSQNVVLRDTGGDPVVLGIGTQYELDTAAGSDDDLNMAGGIRSDSAASLVDTDGDRTTLIFDGNGKLWVNAQVTASVLPSGAATSAKQDTIIGHLDDVETVLGTIDASLADIVSTSDAAASALIVIDDIVYTDDADFTDDTSKFALVGGVYQNTPQSITDGDVGPLLLDANGRVVAKIGVMAPLVAGTANIGDVDVLTLPADPLGANSDASTSAGGVGSISGKLRLMTSQLDAIKTAVEVIDNGVSGSEFQVDVVTLPALPAGNNNIGDVDIASAVPAGDNVIGRVKISDGTEVANVNASNQLEVEVKNASLAVTSSGTLAVAENGALLTAAQLLDDTVYVDDADWTDGSSKHLLVGGLYQSSMQTITDGDVGPLQVDSNGALKVNIVAGAGSGGTASTDDGAFSIGSGSGTPIMGLLDNTGTDSIDENDVGVVRMSANRNLFVNIRDNAGNERGLNIDANGAIAVTNADITSVKTAVEIMDDWDESDRAKVNLIVGQAGITAGAGSVAANTPRVTHASDDPVTTALQLIDDSVFTDDAAFTPGSSKGLAVGFQADEASPDSVNEGDFGVPRMSLERFAINTLKPVATGEGLSVARSIDLDESEEEIKGSAGNLYGWYLQNRATAERYVRFYDNTAAGTTVGTTAPIFTLSLEADQGLHIALPYPIPFATGLCWAATTGVADNDTGAPGANEIVGWALYK